MVTQWGITFDRALEYVRFLMSRGWLPCTLQEEDDWMDRGEDYFRGAVEARLRYVAAFVRPVLKDELRSVADYTGYGSREQHRLSMTKPVSIYGRPVPMLDYFYLTKAR